MKRFLFFPICTVLCLSASMWAQDSTVQVRTPSAHLTEIPDKDATAAELESQGDQLRGQKQYLDAMDFYLLALKKVAPGTPKAQIYNKLGITQLQTGRFPEAKKSFEKSIKADPQFAEPYNNLGVVYYQVKKYPKAIKYYEKAIGLRDTCGSFHSNLGTAYFAREEFDKASEEYGRALQLDPTIFQRKSQIGIAAQMSSPEDRAHYSYVLARMYARAGMMDQAFLYLRHAMEDGYKNIDDVYKENEFASLRKDPRFNDLMAQRPPSIPQ